MHFTHIKLHVVIDECENIASFCNCLLTLFTLTKWSMLLTVFVLYIKHFQLFELI